MCKPVKLTRNSRGIEITVSAEPDDTPIEGNASAIDAETDAETEAEIKRQLDLGNIWAWAYVRVRVTYRGVLSADAGIGSCSYKSEKDFRNDNGYYLQLVDECIDELNKRLVVICGPAKKGA